VPSKREMSAYGFPGGEMALGMSRGGPAAGSEPGLDAFFLLVPLCDGPARGPEPALVTVPAPPLTDLA
jgi:hypothetical protein